jgi:hypothetical protein
VRLYWAETLIANGQVDEGSQQARLYLRLARETKWLDRIEETKNVRNGVTRAFCDLTSVYISAGARGYAIRVLQEGLRYQLQEDLRHLYAEDIQKAELELRTPAHQSLNEKWEEFFRSGKNAASLFDHCTKLGYKHLATRVDLLEGEFRFGDITELPADEIYKIIFYDEKGGWVLA